MLFDSLNSFDQGVVMYFQAHQTFFAHEVFSFLTFLGEWWFILGISIIMLIVFSRVRHYERIAALLISTLGNEAVVLFLKILKHRPRPPYHAYTNFEQFASFPSGHAAIAVSFYGFLLYLILKHEKRSTRRTLHLIGGIFFIFMIGFSRVYLGYHYPSDVLAGFCVGMIFLSLSILVAENHVPRFVRKFLSPIKRRPKILRRAR